MDGITTILLAVGGSVIGGGGIWKLIELIRDVLHKRTAAEQAERERSAEEALEGREMAFAHMERAMERMDAEIARLSDDSSTSRSRITHLETENGDLRRRLDRLDSVVRRTLSRVNDLIRWEQAGSPPPPPWSFQSLADLLTQNQEER